MLFKNQLNSPCSPAATAKVRRSLVVAGEDLVGVHPSAHLAVSAPVVLSLVLQKVAFYFCYFKEELKNRIIHRRKAVKRSAIPKRINEDFGKNLALQM